MENLNQVCNDKWGTIIVLNAIESQADLIESGVLKVSTLLEDLAYNAELKRLADLIEEYKYTTTEYKDFEEFLYDQYHVYYRGPDYMIVSGC